MGERRSRRFWTVAAGIAVLAGGACSFRDAPPELGSTLEPRETTVLIENTGIETLAVYSTLLSTRLATVMPNGRACLELPHTFGTQRLLARPVSGGHSVMSPWVELRPGDGWEWSIGTNTVANQLSLVPSSQCSTG